ncbi:MAG: hypothetical protein IPK82_22680 [Polyangiaceae bacterium]|nr:hypothetical protein [Polyangiaceae bacterium]
MLIAAVFVSILGLAIGPALLAWGRGRAVPTAALEGFTLGLVPAVVLLRLVPHVFEEVGPLAFALLLAGYVALWVVERRYHKSLGRAGQIVALPALLVHAAVDGATLGIVLGGQNSAMTSQNALLIAAAMLIHRIPEGLFVARALVPENGWRTTLLWLTILSVATAAGAALGNKVFAIAPHEVFHGIVAVGLGAILRLATHTHERTPSTRPGMLAFAGALLTGLAIHFLVPARSLESVHPKVDHDSNLPLTFGAIFLVFIVGGGLLRFAPRTWQSKLGILRTADQHNDHDHHHDHDHDHDHDSTHHREQVVNLPNPPPG